MMLYKFSCRAGFTLVEVMVAVLIMTAVMTPLLTTLSQSSRSAAETDQQITAAFLALQLLEEQKTLAYAEIESRDPTEVEGFSGYTWQVLVEPGAGAGLKTITAIVAYAGVDGTGQVILTTDKARR